MDLSNASGEIKEDCNLHHQIEATSEIVNENGTSFIGMKIDCENNAYEFYKSYAHRIGFSVRKHRLKRNSEGKIRRRIFCCSKQGKKGFDKRREHVKFEHPITRVECLAQMTCELKEDNKFEVVSFYEEHTHEPAPTPMKHMLRTKRKITPVQKALEMDAEKAGISVKSAINLMTVQSGGREHNGFLDNDLRNYVSSERKNMMRKGDSQVVMDYFRKMQLEDPSFFYAIQADDDGLIMNMFWADAKSIIDYDYFGDVMCFDTTYRTNGYGRPFAPFISVNHHKQTIIFGAALLYDETAESFKWLFETFLSAMSRKQPKTILTDQCATIGKAIKEAFSETHHRLCVWHLFQNAAKHLSHAFNSSKDFVRDFSSCVYDYEDEEEWLASWKNMLEKHMLVDNKWLNETFEYREKWAMVYDRHMFTADMKSTQRSESMNSVLKKYLKTKHNLIYFFENYNSMLVDRRYQELLAEFKMRQTSLVLKANVEMLKDAREIYTQSVFKMFQDEYIKSLDCLVQKDDKSYTTREYKVKYGAQCREHVVKFDASTNIVECSCMKYTFVGILCAHALKVLDKKNIKKIPAQYIMKRWTKNAKEGSKKDVHTTDISGASKESTGKRYSYLCHDFREISSLASENEVMYNYAHRSFQTLLLDLQKMKKESTLSNVGTEKNLPNKSVQLYDGIKIKESLQQPKRRLKGALERRKYQRTQSKKQGASSSLNISLNQKSSKKKASSQNVADIDSDGLESQPTSILNHEQIRQTSIKDVSNSSTYCDILSTDDNRSFTQLMQDAIEGWHNNQINS